MPSVLSGLKDLLSSKARCRKPAPNCAAYLLFHQEQNRWSPLVKLLDEQAGGLSLAPQLGTNLSEAQLHSLLPLLPCNHACQLYIKLFRREPLCKHYISSIRVGLMTTFLSFSPKEFPWDQCPPQRLLCSLLLLF